MSLRLFEGAAGTGKTTRVLDATSAHLADWPLAEDQRVLALTKYHGSRRRMDAKLRNLKAVGGSLDCLTVDSFAWRLVCRWRSLVRHLGYRPSNDDFSVTTAAAGALLQRSHVATWVARHYPVIVIDEMQDCQAGEVDMIRGLAPVANCLAAADEFQDLRGTESCEAVGWAHSAAEDPDQNVGIETLIQVHRTSTPGLLKAASAIRGGLAVKDGRGFKVLQARNPNVGASFVARNLTWWSSAEEITVISPTTAGRSVFVRRLFERLAEKPFVDNKNRRPDGNRITYGPFTLSWELSQSEQEKNILAALYLGTESRPIPAHILAERAEAAAFPDMLDWLDHQRRIAGRREFGRDEIFGEAKRRLALRRAYGGQRSLRIRAMTVEQAKNREFDSVIVLWPVEVGGGAEVQRRKLYNAITRAKRQAIVILQDPKKERLHRPPFGGY